MNKLTNLVIIAMITLLSGCGSHIQTTSGKSYLENMIRLKLRFQLHRHRLKLKILMLWSDKLLLLNQH